jgi:hypothetical protein
MNQAEMAFNEPLLQENKNRFVLFPIKRELSGNILKKFKICK